MYYLNKHEKAATRAVIRLAQRAGISKNVRRHLYVWQRLTSYNYDLGNFCDVKLSKREKIILRSQLPGLVKRAQKALVCSNCHCKIEICHNLQTMLKEETK